MKPKSDGSLEKLAEKALGQWLLISRNWTGYDMPKYQQDRLTELFLSALSEATAASGAKPDYLSNAQWRLNMRACAEDIRAHVAHVNNTQGMSGSGTESVAASTESLIPKKEVVPHDCLQEKGKQ